MADKWPETDHICYCIERGTRRMVSSRVLVSQIKNLKKKHEGGFSNHDSINWMTMSDDALNIPSCANVHSPTRIELHLSQVDKKETFWNRERTPKM